MDFGDTLAWGTICTKLQDMIALSSAQNMFVSMIQKIVPFWNGHCPKNGSKRLKILQFFDPL